MERVAFLVEQTGEQVRCMLNPESLVVKRRAGVLTRHSVGGHLARREPGDDPLLFTGGGRTEIELEVVFDVDLASDDRPVRDVRQLTGPLWQLAENAAVVDRTRRPPIARFIWGKAWNVPGVVVEVAERFDRFDQTGMPLRSWMRLRFVRVDEPADEPVGGSHEGLDGFESIAPETPAAGSVPVLGDDLSPPPGGGEAQMSPRALGQASQDAFGSPHGWKALMKFNRIDDPRHIGAGGALRVPPDPRSS